MPLRFAVIPTSHPDAKRMLAGYYREIRERFGFDVSRQLAPEDMDPPGGRFLVAYDEGEPVASGGVPFSLRTGEPTSPPRARALALLAPSGAPRSPTDAERRARRATPRGPT